MTDQNLYVWKCPMCKTAFQVHPQPAHPWSKENHLLTCAEKHQVKAPQLAIPESKQHFNYHPEPVSPMNRATGAIEKAKNLNLTSLMYLKWTLFIAVVIDMFLFYWYLEWKSFGIAMMLVIMVALTITFILERRRRDMGDKEPPKMDLGLKDIGKNMTKGMDMRI